MTPIPVILDTDIGDDIDDTWALALLLGCPELEVRLITTAFGDTGYRAALTAKLLAIAGRTDIPVVAGIPGAAAVDRPRPQGQWLGDVRWSGQRDAAAAMARVIDASSEPVTLLAIGPLTNVGQFAQRFPDAARRTRFVGMLGCLRRSHKPGGKVIAEYNVVSDITAAQAAFAASWDMTITPVDTCGLVTLEGERYRRVLGSDDALVRAVIENYRCWEEHRRLAGQSLTRSSVLFDTAAVYLALAEELLEMETLGVVVGDDGMTRIDARGRPARCATRWRDLEGFKDWLVERLLSRRRLTAGT